MQAMINDKSQQWTMYSLWGDVSYARGMETMWDDFGDTMEALGANVPWMLTNGNHERCACCLLALRAAMHARASSSGPGCIWPCADQVPPRVATECMTRASLQLIHCTEQELFARDFPGSGDRYGVTDSGGECNVAYSARYQVCSLGAYQGWQRPCLHYVAGSCRSKACPLQIAAAQSSACHKDCCDTSRAACQRASNACPACRCPSTTQHPTRISLAVSTPSSGTALVSCAP